MPRATARLSIDDLVAADHPASVLVNIISLGLLDGDNPSVASTVHYQRPETPLAQNLPNDVGRGGVDGLPPLYDAGFDSEAVVDRLKEGSFDSETYQWGKMTLTVDVSDEDTLELTLTFPE